MLSKKFQYAIHALQYLAKHAMNHPVSIQAISNDKHIPKKFLEGILLSLRKAEIIASKKGKDGGYYMINKPKEINLVDILQATDRILTLLPCLSPKGPKTCTCCASEKYCPVRKSFADIQYELIQMLQKRTLADVIHETAAASASLINKSEVPLLNGKTCRNHEQENY